jgi:hypothetical protein
MKNPGSFVINKEEMCDICVGNINGEDDIWLENALEFDVLRSKDMKRFANWLNKCIAYVEFRKEQEDKS